MHRKKSGHKKSAQKIKFLLCTLDENCVLSNLCLTFSLICDSVLPGFQSVLRPYPCTWPDIISVRQTKGLKCSPQVSIAHKKSPGLFRSSLIIIIYFSLPNQARSYPYFLILATPLLIAASATAFETASLTLGSKALGMM